MINKNINIFEILKDYIITIYLYPAIETIADPYEKNKVQSLLNCIPVKAIVKDLSMGALAWKPFGLTPIGSKEIIVEKKFTGLFKLAVNIKINDEEYITYKDASRGFGIIERQDYSLVVLEKKKG